MPESMRHEPLPFRREAEPAESDVELIERFRGGDEHAWTELQERYQDRLGRYVRNFLHKDEDADEVVSDAFFRASSHLDRFRTDLPFFNWLIRMARNMAYDRLRYNRYRDRYRERVEPVARLEDVAGTLKGNPEAIFLQGETRGRVMEALEHLTETLRDAYMLVEMQEMSYKDAAGALGIPEAVVRVQVHRARKKLRELLHDLDLEGREAV